MQRSIRSHAELERKEMKDMSQKVVVGLPIPQLLAIVAILGLLAAIVAPIFSNA